MAQSLLIPASVTAKVIKSATPVPSLDGKPFNRDATLEAGVHVHWALPDALTTAKLIPNDPTNRAVFPGVPDLWLVTRFNPAPAANARSPLRGWKAWVVDSVAQSVTPLSQWKLPVRAAKSVHTVAGVLPSATDQGYPGWGLWDNSRNTFDPALAAYYPTARRRFGLFDDLSDIGFNGNASYTVVGWYSVRDYDPLYNSKQRAKLLAGWKLSYRQSSWIHEMATSVLANANAASAVWKPAQFTINDGAAPAAERIQVTQRSMSLGGTIEAKNQRLDLMQKATGIVSASSAAQVGVHVDTGPAEITCHGSVMAVALGTANAAFTTFPNDAVHLYPSIKRAMAAVAALNTSDQNQDFVEMMLQDLDHMKGSAAGVLDMPGAAHALSFQGTPGKSTFYAQIEISAAITRAPATKFGVANLLENDVRMASGHWPEMTARSAVAQKASDRLEFQKAGQGPVAQPRDPHQFGPTDREVANWVADVQAKVKALVQAGAPIDPRMLRVIDYRSKDSSAPAQPLRLGRANGPGGSDGAASWVDVQDPLALAQLYLGAWDAFIRTPSADRLYEIPGPRWYRPWSPQIVVFGGNRSYRFGFDGRLDPDGLLPCRRGGETTYALTVSDGKAVHGSQLLSNPAAVNVAGLPADAKPLLAEALLYDTESASSMASVAGAPNNRNLYSTAVQGLWLARESDLTASQKQTLDKIQTQGTRPSPIAVTPWQNPRDPLFLDANYSHARSAVETDWKLGENQVELAPKNAAALNPPDAQVEVFDERARVTPTIANVLDSMLVKRMALNARGHLARAMKPPNLINDQTFVQMDVLSAPLTGFDAALVDRGFRQRTGALRVNKLEVIDVYGFPRSWNSGIANVKTSQGGPANPWWTDLTPRLPYWSRLQFRLQSAANVEQEATATAPPVCGFLLPDFLEHALEVFDGTGKPIGQLNTTRPQYGSTQAKTLKVTFDVHPWRAAELGLAPGADPLTAIANPTLRSLVAAIAAQKLDVPAGQSNNIWFESGLTALLRVFDTVRGTLDPTRNTADHKIHLLGEPVVVMTARLALEATSTTDPGELRKASAPMTAPPALPTVPVQIGDVTRPDDGVLACFIPGTTPADSRIAPVSKEAAAHAIMNMLTQGAIPQPKPNGEPVTHPFIKDQVSLFQVQPNTHQDVILLCDARGGIYATCGMLPRKKIVIPKEFMDAGLTDMEPSISVGPILSTRRGGEVHPYIPPPKIDGYEDHFTHREAGANGAPTTFPVSGMPPLPPIAELPVGRVFLDEGWVLLTKKKA